MLVSRLVSLPGPRRRYGKSKDVAFTITVVDEFHEKLPLYDGEEVQIVWMDAHNPSCTYRGALNGLINLKTPFEEGVYDLYIEMIAATGIVLPILYKGIEIVNSVDKGHVPTLLECFRIIEYNHEKYYIKENYGQTLGSHVYDSAIVMLEYLLLHSSSICIPKDGYILELGSGTGVIGICLANLAPFARNSILLTDKRTQLDLINDNISLNNVARCSAFEFDWSNQHLVAELLMRQSVPSIIIAADVLYAKDCIDVFFQCINGLYHSSVTILIAQKVRPIMHLRIENGDVLHNFKFIKVYEKFDVVVWSLHKP